jgi:hypothetical protein
MAAIPTAAAIPTMFHFFMILLRVSRDGGAYASASFSFSAARNARSTFNTVARDGEPPSGSTLSFGHDLFRKPFSIFGIML